MNAVNPNLDFDIHVDRSVKPSYPDWVKKLMHPNLEMTGPTEYNLQDDVEQWLHDDQKSGDVTGDIIYKYLRKTNTLSSCLNLQDGLSIQPKGVRDLKIFYKLFSHKAVFLWGSVVLGQNGKLCVPRLYEATIRWIDLNSYLDSNHPALRFKIKY